MSTYGRILGTAILVAMAAAALLRPHPVMAASAAEINRDADAALKNLYDSEPVAKERNGVLTSASMTDRARLEGRRQ